MVGVRTYMSDISPFVLERALKPATPSTWKEEGAIKHDGFLPSFQSL